MSTNGNGRNIRTSLTVREGPVGVGPEEGGRCVARPRTPEGVGTLLCKGRDKGSLGWRRDPSSGSLRHIRRNLSGRGRQVWCSHKGRRVDGVSGVGTGGHNQKRSFGLWTKCRKWSGLPLPSSTVHLLRVIVDPSLTRRQTDRGEGFVTGRGTPPCPQGVVQKDVTGGDRPDTGFLPVRCNSTGYLTKILFEGKRLGDCHSEPRGGTVTPDR